MPFLSSSLRHLGQLIRLTNHLGEIVGVLLCGSGKEGEHGRHVALLDAIDFDAAGSSLAGWIIHRVRPTCATGSS